MEGVSEERVLIDNFTAESFIMRVSIDVEVACEDPGRVAISLPLHEVYHFIQSKVSVLTGYWYELWRVVVVGALGVKREELDKLTRSHFNFSIQNASIYFTITENQF